MAAQDEINRLLKANGATLVRQGNHLVHELPSGIKFVTSKTPSDTRTPKNELARLKRLLQPEPDMSAREMMSEILRKIRLYGETWLPKEILGAARRFLVAAQATIALFPEPSINQWGEELTITWQLSEPEMMRVGVVSVSATAAGISFRSGYNYADRFEPTCDRGSLNERLEWLLGQQRQGPAIALPTAEAIYKRSA